MFALLINILVLSCLGYGIYENNQNVINIVIGLVWIGTMLNLFVATMFTCALSSWHLLNEKVKESIKKIVSKKTNIIIRSLIRVSLIINLALLAYNGNLITFLTFVASCGWVILTASMLRDKLKDDK